MKSKPLSPSKDRISSLPENIIETILCLIPIQEAGRTSILSREWRYHWTKIPKLSFLEYMFEELTGNDQLSIIEQTVDRQSQGDRMIRRCKFFYAIFQVLLLHQGPILEFTLEMDIDYGILLELDQIILHLSRRKTVKKLTLLLPHDGDNEYKLPLSIFSLHQLTYLHLRNCEINHQPTFSGFGSLTTLYLDNIDISAKTLQHLLSKSPLLKRVTLNLAACNILGDGCFTIIDLFKRLPFIEHLTARDLIFSCVFEDAVPQALPTSLTRLKYLTLNDICLSDHHELPLLALLIRFSPNLEIICLETTPYSEYPLRNSATLEDYSDIWLEHLNELKIKHFTNSEFELEFVKLILTKSPLLKKVTVMFAKTNAKDVKLEVLRILSICPHASPVPEIIVK